MIILRRDNAGKLFAKGIFEKEVIKVSVSTSAYVFEDTKEVREIIKDIVLDLYEVVE